MGIGTLSPRSCTTQDYIASSPQESLSLARPMESSPFVLGLQASAKDNNLAINLRFPEISLAHKRQNAQILTYPSAFTVPTGKAHWETLLKARAIETQAYIIAAAQIGAHNEKRTSYGHSMVVDPWGKVLLDMTGEGSEAEIGVVDVDLEYREKIKESMPLLRRTDVYPEI